jgi:hypothetical protein
METMMLLPPEEERRPLEISSDMIERATEVADQAAEVIRSTIISGPNPNTKDAFDEISSKLDIPQRGDIVSSLSRVADDLSIYQNVGQTPVVRIENVDVPISIQSLMSDSAKRNASVEASFSTRSRARETIAVWADQDESRHLITSEASLSGLISQFGKFLQVRIAGIRFWGNSNIDERVLDSEPSDDRNPTNSPNGSGLFRVTVSCTAEDYRIFVTPAYFIDWTFFGYPSSPVTNHILPGRYLFGTDSIIGKITEDPAIFVIPMSFKPRLKRF